MADVVLTHHGQIESAIAEALDEIPLDSLVRGRVVAVKPNETWASQEDTTGITQPDTLRTVLRAILAHQPRELIVTGGAGAAETDEVFRLGGLMDVVTAEGATFFDHQPPPVCLRRAALPARCRCRGASEVSDGESARARIRDADRREPAQAP